MFARLHMKKLLSLIMIFVLLLSITACGNTNTEIKVSEGSGESLTSVPEGENTDAAGTVSELISETTDAETQKLVTYPIIPSTPTVEQARQIVLDYMISLSEVRWTCTKDIDFTKEKSYTSKLYYKAGQTYVGMPYVSHHSGVKYFELNFLDSAGNYTGPITYSSMPGVTCAVSCFTSFRNVSYRNRASGTTNMIPSENKGMVMIGNYVCKGETTADIIKANTDQTIYEAYALLKIADVVTTRSDNGHSRMVYAEPRVIRNSDGTINPGRSLVYLIEQTSSFNSDVKDYNTTWKVNKAYSFYQLYSSDYIPSRLAEFENGLDDAKVTVSGLTTAETLKNAALSGKVASNFTILYTRVEITDASGNVVSLSEQAKDYSNDTTSFTVDLSSKPLSVSVADLPAGKYHFKASAFIGYGECILGEFDFEK